MNKKVIYIIIGLIVIIGIIILIISLNKKDDNIQINIQELAEQIIQSRSFEDELNMVDKDITMSDYDFTQDEIKNLISYQSTGATSEELVILQVNDKSKLNDVKEKINTRLEERKEAFESYLPEEVFKIDNNILEVKNDYIICAFQMILIK